MSNLTVPNNKQLPVPMPPEMLPLNGALEVFQTALNAGVAIYAKAEDAKTQRALILAEKEIQALSIEAETQKAMHREDLLHESRMKILHIVERLLVEHAESLTPDILSATQILISCLREMKQGETNQDAEKEVQQILNQIRMRGEQIQQNISTAKDAEVKKRFAAYQEDIASQAAQARCRDALVRQIQKAVEDGDFDKMLEIKTLLGQLKE